MNSLKELGVKGLKELKASDLKGLIFKPKTANINTKDMKDLTKSREEIRKKNPKAVERKKGDRGSH